MTRPRSGEELTDASAGLRARVRAVAAGAKRQADEDPLTPPTPLPRGERGENCDSPPPQRLQRLGELRRVELAVAVLVETLHHPLDVLVLEAGDFAQLLGVELAIAVLVVPADHLLRLQHEVHLVKGPALRE